MSWAERLTLFLARSRTMTVLAAIGVSWMAWNLVSPALDPPPFVWLQRAVILMGLTVILLGGAAARARARRRRNEEVARSRLIDALRETQFRTGRRPHLH